MVITTELIDTSIIKKCYTFYSKKYIGGHRTMKKKIIYIILATVMTEGAAVNVSAAG